VLIAIVRPRRRRWHRRRRRHHDRHRHIHGYWHGHAHRRHHLVHDLIHIDDAARAQHQRDRHLTLEIDQDIEAWNSTWQFFISPSFSNTNWRISQISLIAIHNPYDFAAWTWHPAPDLSLKFEIDNIIPYRFGNEQINYAGPRNLNTLASIQDVAIRTRPRLFIQLRKTF